MAPFAHKFGWVLVFTVLLLFLFPLQWGSFTQTHGPTTAFRALHAAQALMAGIAMVASLAMSLVVLVRVSATEVVVPVHHASESSLQLRC